MNVVILRGTLSRPPVTRELPSGEHLTSFEVTTRPPAGPAESVPVCWFGAPARARSLSAGAEVVVTGRVRRRFFRAGASTASRTEVVAATVAPAHHAGRVATAVERALTGVDPVGVP